MKILNEDINLKYKELLKRFKNNVDDDLIFIEIINLININENFFDSKLFIEMFDLISDGNKKKYWKILIDKCTVRKQLTVFEIKLLLNMINDEEIRFEIFSLLLNSSFFPNCYIDDLLVFITIFETKKYKILDLLFDNNKVTNMAHYQLDDFILNLDENERKSMIIYLRKKISKILDERVLLWLFKFLKDDDIVNVFKELIINDNNFNEEILFRNISIENNANLSFLLLDLYIGERLKTYNNQEKKQLYERAMRYVIDFKEVFCEEYPDEKILYKEINKLVCREYGVNEENFKKFILFFGYESFNFLECSNIKKLLNLDTNKFDLVIELFTEKYTHLDQHTLNNVLNAFYQREFLLERKEEYLIFGEFDKYIKEQNKIEIIRLIDKINEKVDINKMLNVENLDVNYFIEKLLAYDNHSKDVLHLITNKYIMRCREEFVILKINEAHLELDLNCRIEKSMAKKLFFSNISVSNIIELLLHIDKSRLSEQQISLLNNQELLEKVILYKIKPVNDNHDAMFYKNLSLLEKMVNILWEDGKLDIRNNNNDKITYVYVPKKVSNVDKLSILVELDIDNLSKSVLDDCILYEKLRTILEKYKFLGWGNTFDRLSKKVDLTLDKSVIAAIINYFYKIFSEMNENINMTKILVYANCYASASNKFEYLLGEEDYRLICANTGDYKAPAPKTKRLELAVEHLKEMFLKEKVTIPSYDKNYVLENGKVVNVVVGNSTNIKNLTIGERTDSCLRICGIFYELFKFIIKDKNGFNICFYDFDGKFVSRVSGVRNGNTVFLNQLRNSLNPKINNNDLYNVLKLVCNDLLMISANSEVPIDNIVISSQEALRGMDDQNQYIGDDVFKNNLYNLPFNYDIDGYALLIASRKTGEYLKKDIQEELPEYKCCSDKIIFINDLDLANKRFKQFYLINQLLNGKKIDEIQLPNNEIVSCICSDKFMIVKTVDNEIASLILDKFNDDSEIHKTIDKLLDDLKYTNVGGIKR